VKIITIVRTRNEERNIANFCQAYDFSDLILVADGGSDDNTIEIASTFPKVKVGHFWEQAWKGDIWRNPEPEHFNFLIQWAEAEGADWIITDDCDCRPNRFLRKDARNFLEGTDLPFAFAVRLYLLGTDNLRNGADGKYFPALSKPPKGGPWTPGLWAWRAELGTRLQGENPWDTGAFPCDITQALIILPPHCLLHFPWPDEKEIKRKLAFYGGSKQVEGMEHPLEWGGSLEPCPDWMYES